MQLQRKISNIFKFAVTLLVLACFLPSCIQDDYDLDDGNGSEGYILPKGRYYVVFDINDADGYKTRGELGDPHPDGDFVDGDHGEHEISSGNSLVIFLNADNKVVEVSELAGNHNEHPEAWIESNYIAKFDVDEDYQTPNSCIVLLNVTKYKDQLKNSVGQSKDYITTLEWAEKEDPMSIGREGALFTMSNSVYFKDGKVVDAQPLPKEVVQDADGPLDPEKVIHVTVERMVAKASLKYNENPERYLETEDWFIPTVDNANLFIGFHPETGLPLYRVVHFRVHPTGWALNGLERESYLIKHITKPGQTVPDNFFNALNDPGRYRSHWAVDPHYAGNDFGGRSYPWQYRDAINRKTIDYYKKWVTLDPSNNITIVQDNNILKNFSYNEIKDMNNLQREIYVPENTFDYAGLKSDLDDRPELLAGTHFILTAVLKTALKEGDFQENDIWRDRIGNLYESELDAFMALIVTFNYALQSESEMKFLWYDWNSHGDGSSDFVASAGRKYSLYYDHDGELIEATPDNIERIAKYYEEANRAPTVDDPNFTEILRDGDIKCGDGQKMIVYDNFKILTNDGKHDPLYIYDYDYWEYVKEYNRNLKKDEVEIVPTPLRAADVNDFKSIMFNWIGPIDHYKNGMMYYFAPVKIDTDIYGVVRNNWYHFVLEGISNLGTSVDKPGEPIIPNQVEQHEQAIDIKANILPWHTVSQEVPILPPQ